MTITTKTIKKTAVRLGIAGVSAALLAGCSTADLQGAPICDPGAPQVVRAVGSSSKSDLELAQRIAPDAAEEIAALAGDSCAKLEVGVTDNNPEANLVLVSVDLRPPRERAPNRKPYIDEQINRAQETLAQELGKLDSLEATRGSPVLGTLVALADHARAAGDPAGCTATFLLSDGFAFERVAGVQLNLYRARIPQQDIETIKRALKTLLEPLAGGVVVVMGAGGDGPGGGAGRRAEAVLREILQAAGIELVWARATDVATRCGK